MKQRFLNQKLGKRMTHKAQLEQGRREAARVGKKVPRRRVQPGSAGPPAVRRG